MTTPKYTPKDIERFWSKVNIGNFDDCWEWTSYCFPRGYGRFALYYKTYGAHRIAWILTFGEIPKGLQVCHHCDNRKCCNPSHLFLGTHQDNVDDKVHKSRQARNKGELSGTHKLTTMQVEEIRECYRMGLIRQWQLAKKYGVTQQTISKIVNYQRWEG